MSSRVHPSSSAGYNHPAQHDHGHPAHPHHGKSHHGKHAKRRSRKRRAAAHGLLMGAMIFGGGFTARAKASPRVKRDAPVATRLAELPVVEVTVSMDSFVALPPYLAYEDLIDEAAEEHEVNPDLIHAVIQTESAFNAMAESPAGAQGLMQLMPALQKELGVEDPFDPRENVMAGSLYLKRLLNSHHGNVELALASYNAGPGNVKRYRGMPPFGETRRYVKKIKALIAEAKTAD